MGGGGSGPRESGKDLVETCRSIDIRQWQRRRLLDPESHFPWCWQEAGVTGTIKSAGNTTRRVKARARAHPKMISTAIGNSIASDPCVGSRTRFFEIVCPEIGNGLTIRDRPESRLSLYWPHG